MSKHEYIGNYELTYSKYLTYKDKWVTRHFNLGKCLGKDEAFMKAINFIHSNEQDRIDYGTMYVSDGWGNKFYAKGQQLCSC